MYWALIIMNGCVTAYCLLQKGDLISNPWKSQIFINSCYFTLNVIKKLGTLTGVEAEGRKSTNYG
jgi:hypothetical protein